MIVASLSKNELRDIGVKEFTSKYLNSPKILTIISKYWKKYYRRKNDLSSIIQKIRVSSTNGLGCVDLIFK